MIYVNYYFEYPLYCVHLILTFYSFSDLDRIKTQFLQTFGFERLLTFNKLTRMGLLSSRDTLARRTIQASTQQLQGSSHSSSSQRASASVPFQQVVKKLGLSVKNPNQQNAEQDSLLVDQSR